GPPPGKRRTVGRTRTVLRPRARRPASAGERSPSTWRPWEARGGRAFEEGACLRVRPHGSESPEGATTNRGHMHMTTVSNLGFPRIGLRRELKKAVESYWRGESTAERLHDQARALRLRHWQLQHAAGADVVPCNDFSLYDHVLDTAVLFDAIPARYRALFDSDPLRGYFSMARGWQDDGLDLPALEMTKWFDANYH